MFQPVSPCFTPGTLIVTDRGRRPVETLRRGDRVVTRDNGLRRIVWAGRRDLTRDDLAAVPDLRPVLVRRGALGTGPARDMIVSPHHRFLTVAKGEETLVQARFLLDRPGIDRVPVLGVSYLHLLCEAHEVLLADALWTESFHPDDRTLLAMDPAQREEILMLFPDIETMGAARRFALARPEGKSRFEL